ncbi:MerR family transcriptional regulator (plasmid) [Peribacillus sp. JNUCC 23]
MADSEWFTVSEACEKINVPVETIRRYLRSHNVHLKVKKLGKKYFIHHDSLTVIKQIRALYDQGKNIDEVEESLSASGVAMTITVKSDDESMTVHVADELQEIKRALQDQEKFNQALLQKLDEQNAHIQSQHDYIKQSLERRDRELMQAISESQQARIETATAKQKGFFSRLFGK